MSEATYWHGGAPGIPLGGYILPPSETGAPCSSDYGAAQVHRRDRVYMATSEAGAAIFAGLHPSKRGMIYRVEPEGEIEPDPDCTQDGLSWQAPRARVVGSRWLKKSERRMVLQVMAPEIDYARAVAARVRARRLAPPTPPAR